MLALQSKSENRCWHRDTPLTSWLKTDVHCRISVTITFGTAKGLASKQPSERTVEEIVRKGIKRINTLCYGNLVKRKGYSIGAVTVIEGKGQFERIHVHIGLDPPPSISLHRFSNIVARAFKPSKWIEHRPYMKKCWNQDWINYMLKFGQEALVPSCFFAAKHPNA
jgi:hypothetical protein